MHTAGTLATHPGTPGTRLSGEGRGKLGKEEKADRTRLRQPLPLHSDGPPSPLTEWPVSLLGWAGGQKLEIRRLGCQISLHRQQVVAGTLNLPQATGAWVRPASVGPAGEGEGLAARMGRGWDDPVPTPLTTDTGCAPARPLS